MEYHDALERLERDGNVLAHDDASAGDARARFERLFARFTPEALRESVHATYAGQPFFNDALKTFKDMHAEPAG